MSRIDNQRESVCEVLSNVLNIPVSQLHADPVLVSHGWDSIVSLNALVQLEKTFGVRFDLTRFHAVRSADDVAALVESLL